MARAPGPSIARFAAGLAALLAAVALAGPALAGPDAAAAPASAPAAPIATPVSIAGPAFGAASVSASTAAPSSATAAQALDDIQATLKATSAGRRLVGLTDDQLKARLAAIPPIQSKLTALIAVLTPRLQDADARLAQLGPAPAAGQPPEAPQTAETRRSIERFRQQAQGRLAQARLLTVEADQLSTGLAEQIRANFAARLWKRDRSVLDPGLWRDFVAGAPEDLGRASRALSDEADRMAQAHRSPGAPEGFLGGAVLAVALALLLALPARSVLGRLGRRRAEKAGQTHLTRTLLALWLVIVSVLTPLFALLIARAVLDGAGILTPLIERALNLVIAVTAYATLMEGLGRAILSPGRPGWRIAPLPDKVAARLALYPGLIALAVAVATTAAGLDSLLGVSLSTSLAVDCVVLIVEFVAATAGLAMLGRARSAIGEPPPADGQGERPSPGRPATRLPWILAAIAAWLALGAALAAILVGYLALASFIMRETVWIATVLATLFLLVRLVDDLFPDLLGPHAPVGRMVRTGTGLSEAALEQTGVLLSGVARLALMFAAWALIVAPFGTSAGAMALRFTAIDTTFRIGQVQVSPGAIFGAIGIFLIGLLSTRGVRGWMEGRYLPKTHLDQGLRASVASGISYLGVLVALVFALAYLGLSFSRIALFAGALSVGIGFGLQAIIGNFVSGLILMAERPVRVGDWIAIGDLEGDVKRISIRATEIEMADHSRLIVPNSDLISKTVRNVTHADAIGRVRIVLRMAGDSDPQAVRGLIAGAFSAHREVLKEPKPAVYLSDVRDGDLEFTAFAYVATARASYRVKSELLFQIVPALRQAGIVLASAAPVVNIGLPERLPERLIEPAEDEAAGAREPAPAPEGPG